jgi:hypothetical protein
MHVFNGDGSQKFIGLRDGRGGTEVFDNFRSVRGKHCGSPTLFSEALKDVDLPMRMAGARRLKVESSTGPIAHARPPQAEEPVA